jgi:hypothetical protein
MKHCHFSILYNELPFLKQKLAFLYEYFQQIIFYDLNVACDKPHFSTDGSHEYILDYPDPQNKITIIEETDLSQVTKYYGGSGIAKRKMFTLASQYVRDDIDIFWCSDMDEFFCPSLIKEAESTLYRYPEVNSVSLDHYYFWKDFDLILCDPAFDTWPGCPPRIARHKQGNMYGHCSLHEQYPKTKILDDHKLYHFAWLGEERCMYKFDYWKRDALTTRAPHIAAAYCKYVEEVWNTFDKKDINPPDKMWGYPNMHPNPIIKKGVKFFQGTLPTYVNYDQLGKDLGIKQP